MEQLTQLCKMEAHRLLVSEIVKMLWEIFRISEVASDDYFFLQKLDEYFRRRNILGKSGVRVELNVT